METLNIEYEPVIRKSLMDTIIDNIVEAVDYIKKDSRDERDVPKIVLKLNSHDEIICNVVCWYSIIDIFRMHNVQPTDNTDDNFVITAYDKVSEDIISELQDRGVRVEPATVRDDGYSTYIIKTNED